MIDKAQALSGTVTPAEAEFTSTTQFGPVPAVSLSSTNNEYVAFNDASSDLPGPTSPPSVGLVAITGTPSADDVSMAEVQVPMYETSPWPSADQPGDPGSVDTNDDRFLSAVWQNGELWVPTVPSRCHHVPASAEVAAENPGRRAQAVAGMTRAERDEPFEMDFASGWNTKFGRHAMTDNGPGPWRDWLTGGELPSRDFYVGLVAYEGGAMIEYALFGDPDWDHDTTKEVLDDWNDFVEDDLDAVGCTCEHVRVAVFRTDTRTPEERMSPEGALIPKKRSSTFYYWHSDQDCPGNERLNL